MKILKIVTIFIFCLFFLSSCYQNYEEYGFKSTENVFSWGLVAAKLNGSERNLLKLRDTVVKSSPYELFIVFISKTVTEGSIHISELTLSYAKTKKVVFEKNDIAEQPIEKPYNYKYYKYGTDFSFKSIETEFDDMVLRVKFLLKQGDKSTEYNAEIFFEKKYRKLRRIKAV